MPIGYRVNERRWRRHGGAALGAMALIALMALLLAAVACDNNSVDESVPSGARPAPLPKIGRAHLVSPPARAGEPSRAGLELPESHAPGAGTAAAESPGRAAAAHHARGEDAANGHLSATGDLVFDGDVSVSCSVFSSKGFEIGFGSAEAPQVILRIDDFLGPGSYQAGALVRAAAAHGLLESAGRATLQLKVARTDRPHDGSLVSGSFAGAYAGRAGEGTISGRIDGCFYDGVLP